MTGARNRAHMDYDTNPGGFQNWFWYLPFANDEQDVTEGWFSDVFNKKKPVPVPQISPEEFQQKLKSWKNSMNNAYKKLPELINQNQWAQVKATASKIKNGARSGATKGYISFQSEETKTSMLKRLDSALNMKIFDEIKINPQDFAGGGTGALVGLALGGLAGAAIGGALGSSRRSNKLSAQELAVMNAHQKTNTNRQDNKAAVISRIEKFHPTFIKMLNLPPLEKKSVTDLKNTNLDSDRIEPTMEQNVTEENQDDRNARIIAGEIEDAMSQGNEQLAKQKIKELIRAGYTLDKDGQLQRMGMYEEAELQEKQDACYHKVKSRYKVWPSAYASGALVQCRKKGAANWGNKSKK